jgi:hypothetical protein
MDPLLFCEQVPRALGTQVNTFAHEPGVVGFVKGKFSGGGMHGCGIWHFAACHLSSST